MCARAQLIEGKEENLKKKEKKREKKNTLTISVIPYQTSSVLLNTKLNLCSLFSCSDWNQQQKMMKIYKINYSVFNEVVDTAKILRGKGSADRKF